VLGHFLAINKCVYESIKLLIQMCLAIGHFQKRNASELIPIATNERSDMQNHQKHKNVNSTEPEKM